MFAIAALTLASVPGRGAPKPGMAAMGALLSAWAKPGKADGVAAETRALLSALSLSELARAFRNGFLPEEDFVPAAPEVLTSLFRVLILAV